MRICAPVTSLNEDITLGGGYFHTKNLQGLADLGVECLLPLAFQPDYQPRPNWDVRAIPIRHVYKLGALLSNIVFFLALLWLHLIRRERFDLMRVGDLYHFGPAAYLAARWFRVPTVGMLYHIEEEQRKQNAIIGWTARRMDGLIVTSRASAEHVQRFFGVAPHRVYVVPGGASDFPGAPTEKREAKKRLGLAEGAPVIGFLGMLRQRKNVALLLEAFARLAPRHPQAQLLIVGDGPERANLMRRAQALGISDCVKFAGRLDEAGKATAYRAMDLFAFPSLMEGFGLAVVDAMAQGVPAVVSDRGSLPEIVRHEHNGLVVPIEDPEPMARALDRLLSDPGLRGAMCEAAREDSRHFTWAVCAEETLKAYRHVLAKAHEPRLGVILNTGDSLAVMQREGQRERFIDHYLRRYADVFSEVVVFSYGNDRLRPLPQVYFVPGKPGWKGPLYSFFMPVIRGWEMRRLTLLRVMQTSGALPAVLARLIYRTPFIVTYGYRYGDFMRLRGRRWYGWWLDRLERWALRLATKVIVTTRSLEEYVGGITDKNKIAFLPNGADLQAFAPRQFESPQGRATALFVGRLTEQKNLDLAIRALVPLKDRVRLVCAGEGPEAERLRELARQAGVELELLGVVPHQDLPRLHRQADLFLFPSRMEGHPKALVEAMASGLPCIGTRAPGVSDVITDQVDGLLTAATPEALTDAIRRVLDDPVLARSLGLAAHKTAAEQFDLNVLLSREIDLLQNTVREAAPCAGC